MLFVKQVYIASVALCEVLGFSCSDESGVGSGQAWSLLTFKQPLVLSANMGCLRVKGLGFAITPT